MADQKLKSAATDAKATPVSAPELTDEQKQKLEAELTVEKTEAAKVPVAEADAKSKTITTGDSADATSTEAVKADEVPGGHRLHRFFAGYWRRKKWSIPLTILVIIGILAAIPYSRYALAAYVISQPLSVTVTDQSTKKPVSSADIIIDGQTFKTNSKGMVEIAEAKVGDHTVSIAKKYYESTSFEVFVPLTQAVSHQVAIKATGRQVPISVTNKLTGKPLENVTLKASGVEVKTDKEGKATIVLPADKQSLTATLSNGGYNSFETKITVTDQTVKENNFTLVPSGKIYFLSRQSGKIDVVKTDLDGANRQVVVTGTGKEEDRNTVLLASRDWKFLALLSKRDSGLARLYLIDTATDKMTEMDAGDANFQLVGWSNHDFVYRVQRNAVKYWQPNYLAMKSFNADKKQILTLDQSLAEGDEAATYYQSFGSPYLVDNKLVYTASWEFYGNYFNRNMAGRSHSLRVTSVSSVAKKDVKTWPADQVSGYIQVVPYRPHELYLSAYSELANKDVYYEYENGEVKDAAINQDKFQTTYATYLESPNGKQAFWSEERDGRATFFIGDNEGENAKQIAVLDEFQVYGWYSDDYLLASKKGSELYIMPVAGGTPLKVADYHKPQLSYRGYGGGYGGL